MEHMEAVTVAASSQRQVQPCLPQGGHPVNLLGAEPHRVDGHGGSWSKTRHHGDTTKIPV